MRAEGRERALDVGRQRRDELDFLTAVRMPELEPVRVQRLPADERVVVR